MKLRKWVVQLLSIIAFICIAIISIDFNSDFKFVVSKLICLAIIILVYKILAKYSNLFE